PASSIQKLSDIERRAVEDIVIRRRTAQRALPKERKRRGMKQRMYRIAMVAFCTGIFLLCGSMLQAQTPAEKLQELSQALHLNPAQKSQLLPILEAEAPKIEDVKKNPNLSPKQRAMELRSIHQQADPQVQRILSPQQYEKWQYIRQQEIEKAMQQ